MNWILFLFNHSDVLFYWFFRTPSHLIKNFGNIDSWRNKENLFVVIIMPYFRYHLLNVIMGCLHCGKLEHCAKEKFKIMNFWFDTQTLNVLILVLDAKCMVNCYVVDSFIGHYLQTKIRIYKERTMWTNQSCKYTFYQQRINKKKQINVLFSNPSKLLVHKFKVWQIGISW